MSSKGQVKTADLEQSRRLQDAIGSSRGQRGGNQEQNAMIRKIREVVPNLTPDDIGRALAEANGDADMALTMCLEGTIPTSQWQEVGKKKPETQWKSRDGSGPPGRGRGGMRGRGYPDRGRGGPGRGGRGAHRGRGGMDHSPGPRTAAPVKPEPPAPKPEPKTPKPAVTYVAPAERPIAWQTPSAAVRSAPRPAAPPSPPSPVPVAPEPVPEPEAPIEFANPPAKASWGRGGSSWADAASGPSGIKDEEKKPEQPSGPSALRSPGQRNTARYPIGRGRGGANAGQMWKPKEAQQPQESEPVPVVEPEAVVSAGSGSAALASEILPKIEAETDSLAGRFGSIHFYGDKREEPATEAAPAEPKPEEKPATPEEETRPKSPVTTTAAPTSAAQQPVTSSAPPAAPVQFPGAQQGYANYMAQAPYGMGLGMGGLPGIGIPNIPPYPAGFDASAMNQEALFNPYQQAAFLPGVPQVPPPQPNRKDGYQPPRTTAAPSRNTVGHQQGSGALLGSVGSAAPNAETEARGDQQQTPVSQAAVFPPGQQYMYGGAQPPYYQYQMPGAHYPFPPTGQPLGFLQNMGPNPGPNKSAFPQYAAPPKPAPGQGGYYGGFPPQQYQQQPHGQQGAGAIGATSESEERATYTTTAPTTSTATTTTAGGPAVLGTYQYPPPAYGLPTGFGNNGQQQWGSWGGQGAGHQ